MLEELHLQEHRCPDVASRIELSNAPQSAGFEHSNAPQSVRIEHSKALQPVRIIHAINSDYFLYTALTGRSV
jgi:hypothetical protein